MSNLVELVQQVARHYARPDDGQPIERRANPGPRKRNPWRKCPRCYRRNPYLCDEAEEGAEPCGLGLRCGCCTGPHTKEKSR